MIFGLTGILAGIIIGLIINFTIPIEYIKYSAVTIIGILDTLFNSLKHEAQNKKMTNIVFLSGFLFNIILALSITFLGERLGLDLYLAATVVFTFRIFSNLGMIQRVLVEKYFKKGVFSFKGK